MLSLALIGSPMLRKHQLGLIGREGVHFKKRCSLIVMCHILVFHVVLEDEKIVIRQIEF